MASIPELHRPESVISSTLFLDGQNANPHTFSPTQESFLSKQYDTPGGADRTGERRLRDLKNTVDILPRIDDVEDPRLKNFTDRLITVLFETDDSQRTSIGALTEHAAFVFSQGEDPSIGMVKAKEQIDFLERADILRAKANKNERGYVEQRPSALVILGEIDKWRRILLSDLEENLENVGISKDRFAQLQEMFSGLRELGLFLEYHLDEDDGQASFTTSSTGSALVWKMSTHESVSDPKILVEEAIKIFKQNADKRNSQPPEK